MGSAKDGRASGELIRAYRELKGWSQEELAQIAGVSDRTIRNLESGVRRAHRSTMDQIISGLGLGDNERDTVLAAWTGVHRPCSLPSDIADFVGRASSLDLVTRMLRAPRPAGAASVCVLAGMGGVGKTTLALHVAHRVAGDYPDGQLYLDLRGTQSDPVEPGEALARMLARLGIPASQLPRGVDARAELWRDRLAGRRYLIVLDDAEGEAQVRALLPGTATSAVVITSRSRLPGLTTARLIQLDVLNSEEALALLASGVGDAARLDAQPQAAQTLIELCGRLPLAVRVVAALLAGRPSWSVGYLASLLADERHRLGVLEAGDVAVAASISLSYQALPPAAGRMFRLLGKLEAADFAAWIGAAVCDLPLTEAYRIMERLVDAFLLEVTATDETGHPRYRFHDLVRIYSRYHVSDHVIEIDERLVVQKATRAWLTMAEHAGGHIHGYASGMKALTEERWLPEEAVARTVAANPLLWLDAERSSITAMVRQAANTGMTALACDLASSVANYCSLHCHFADWQAMMDNLRAAAQLAGDETVEASATLGLGALRAEQGDPLAARELIRSAVATANRLGLVRLEIDARVSLGIMNRTTGDLVAAMVEFQKTIELAESLGDDLMCAYAQSEAGAVYSAQGELDRAEGLYIKALATLREIHDIRALGKVILRLSIVHQLRGDAQRAMEGMREALTLAESSGDVRRLNEIRYRLALLILESGDSEQAAALLRQAAKESREAGDAMGLALCHDALGRTQAQLGDHRAARDCFDLALAYYRRAGLDSRVSAVRQRIAGLTGHTTAA